jgi:hypothetical protein
MQTVEQFLARGPRLTRSTPPGVVVPKGFMGMPMPPQKVVVKGGRGAYCPGGHKPRGIKSTKVYEAAQREGFRYPNQFREPSPKGFHVEKHAKPSIGRCV